MRKTNKLYPAEEWLIKNWLGNSFNLFSIDASIKITKEKINNYIHKQLLQTKQTPPFNPELFFVARKIIRKEELNLSDKFLGLLQPIKGGFILKVNSKIPLKRKRFTIAHEIGHTFFFDVNSEIPQKKFITSNSPYWVEEDYVNSIACEILLPTPFLKETINQGKFHTPSLDSLKEIGNIYQVSNQVLSKQLIQNLKLWDCLYFHCRQTETLKHIHGTIVKGISFKKSQWNISMEKLQSNGQHNFSFLRDNIAKALKFPQKLFTSQFEVKDQAYEIQTRQMYATEKICEVLIMKK